MKVTLKQNYKKKKMKFKIKKKGDDMKFWLYCR